MDGFDNDETYFLNLHIQNNSQLYRRFRYLANIGLDGTFYSEACKQIRKCPEVFNVNPEVINFQQILEQSSDD